MSADIPHLSLTGRIAHFDLTYIPESNKQLKELAGFLIANYGRQHIITLPRGKRKRVIFEEVSRTLDIPGGEQLVSEFYAQLSKFSTWIISIVQQYSRFQQSGIRPIVFGNAKQFFFTRMNDRRDVEDVARDIELSQATKEAITRLPFARASSSAQQVCRSDLLPSRRSAAALRNDPQPRLQGNALLLLFDGRGLRRSAAGSCASTRTSSAGFSPKPQLPLPA